MNETVHAAAQVLAAHGYDYDEQLHVPDQLIGFRRVLPGGQQAVVQLQFRGEVFTVNLRRWSAAEIEARAYDSAPSSRGARLGQVLWFVHNLRTYPQPDQWWRLNELPEALAALVTYGLPWLEAPDSPTPWRLSAPSNAAFVDAVKTIGMPRLAAWGFEYGEQILFGRIIYPYGLKQLPTGHYQFVEFQSVYGLDPALASFDVRLQHAASGNPLDFGGSYAAWRSASLGLLRWRAARARPTYAVDEVQDVLWHYTSAAELAACLRDAAGHIEALAVPWFHAAAAAQ